WGLLDPHIAALATAPHFNDVHPQPRAVLVRLPRDLFGLGKFRFHPTDIHMDRPRVRALLNDPGEDIALLATEGTHHLFVLGVADALHDHLPRGRGCDSAEALRGVVELHLVVLVLAGEDGDPAAAAIEHDPGVFVPFRGLPVGR